MRPEAWGLVRKVKERRDTEPLGHGKGPGRWSLARKMRSKAMRSGDEAGAWRGRVVN